MSDSPSQAGRRADALLALIAADVTSSTLPAAPGSPFTGPVILIDGRSGSGKTDLATALAARWPGPATLAARWPGPATLVRLDDLYPGWDGLDAASIHLHDELLASPTPRWQRYNWTSGTGAEWTSVDPARPLIVEGAGTLTRRNAALATLRVWVELDDATRRTRALARDGATYEPHWERWAAQERAFIARENPVSLADVVFTEP